MRTCSITIICPRKIARRGFPPLLDTMVISSHVQMKKKAHIKHKTPSIQPIAQPATSPSALRRSTTNAGIRNTHHAACLSIYLSVYLKQLNPHSLKRLYGRTPCLFAATPKPKCRPPVPLVYVNGILYWVLSFGKVWSGVLVWFGMVLVLEVG